MRKPERLYAFYDTMRSLHAHFIPDWRFGQLMSNFWGWYWGQTKKDLFFPEEDETLEYFVKYIKTIAGNAAVDQYLGEHDG